MGTRPHAGRPGSEPAHKAPPARARPGYPTRDSTHGTTEHGPHRGHPASRRTARVPTRARGPSGTGPTGVSHTGLDPRDDRTRPASWAPGLTPDSQGPNPRTRPLRHGPGVGPVPPVKHGRRGATSPSRRDLSRARPERPARAALPRADLLPQCGPANPAQTCPNPVTPSFRLAQAWRRRHHHPRGLTRKRRAPDAGPPGRRPKPAPDMAPANTNRPSRGSPHAASPTPTPPPCPDTPVPVPLPCRAPDGARSP
ncbi:hypothetical protein QFZ74_001711 [Streptomyces sp. V3I7]|nr:hypothetical protein [Streptomyces sp. V3I7]